MASAVQYASAPTGPVGLYDALCANTFAPTTNRLWQSQLCRYLLTALLRGLVPMMVPPVLCVLWYGTTVHGSVRALASFKRVGLIDLAMSLISAAAWRPILCSFSLYSKLMR